jgi:phytanoyl-CoA hydroxylase
MLASGYAEHGFVVAQGMFSSTECRAMEEELLRFQRGGYADAVPAIEPLDGPMGREELLGRYMYVFQPHAVSSLVREWMVDRRLRNVLGSVVGAHLPGWDGAYKCMQSMFVTRKGGAPGSPWHQDEHPIPTRDRSLCGVWIALSDATVENGALWIVRGSHKPGLIYDRQHHTHPAVDSMPQAVGFERPGTRQTSVTHKGNSPWILIHFM